MIKEFQHHGIAVKAREDLIGKHREFCLCHQCNKLNIENSNKNCKIANALFALDCLCEITTPVFYCKEFENK